MRFAILSGLAPIVFLISPPVHAQEETPAITVSGGVTLISDYRFRGISLTGKDPAIQGTINFAHKSGLYVGTWGSSLGLGDRYGPTEVDLYGGWAGTIAKRTSLDVTMAYYSYPGGKRGGQGAAKIEYFETTARLSYDFGPVRTTVGSGYSWDQAALGGDHLYLFGEAAAPVPGTPITLKAHGGRSKGAISPKPGGYYDWSLGADVTFDKLTLGLSYIDTNLSHGNQADGAALVSLSAGF
ncbi:TorF family putative porin [Novosphingobium sp. BL-8H]|uniref:TorF family putative porin n=1 Tax=Novosphingobium sp. BL-8H TaxID=3127640 RepID=UPI003756FD66